MAFITPYGAYAYKTMSFGLKNVGASDQRAIQLCFADQLHRNVEAYVDDVVVKTKSQDQFILDLEETFNSLRKFRWKLNPTKCVFSVPSGKLLAAGFIKEVYHPEWLANPVLVQKKNNNEWMMCVEYTDLNKHCPKDPFGLPRIDQVIDSTTGYVLLSLLDYYSGYHQIALKEEDQIKTAFITPYGHTPTRPCPLG